MAQMLPQNQQLLRMVIDLKRPKLSLPIKYTNGIQNHPNQ
jgi:hypothetical protein